MIFGDLVRVSKMVFVNIIAFVVSKILHNLAFMLKFLFTNNC